jgi:hypothetical protein
MESPQGASTKLRLLAAGLVLLPILMLLPGLAEPEDPGRPPTGDYAALELYTRLALHGEQRLGPYSRFHFQHPGPAYFYAAVPLYRLLGETFRGITATALLLNVAGIMVLLWIAGRAGTAPLLAASVLLAAFVRNRGPDWFYSAWNPAVVVLPFGVALFALAAFIVGESAPIVIAAAAASFAVQTHLGTVPALGAAFALAALSRVSALRRLGGQPPLVLEAREHRAWAAAFAVTAALWALPLAEQFSKGGGNLTAIAQFTRTGAGEGHPLPEALDAVARYAFAMVVGSGPHAGLAAGLLVLAIAAAFVVSRHRQPFAAALAAVSLAGLAAAVVASMRVAGPIFGYLVRWMAMLAVAGLAAVGAALCARAAPSARGRRALPAIAVIGLVVLTALNVQAAWRARQQKPKPMWESVAAGQLATELAEALSRAHVQRPVVDVRAEANRDLVLALLLSLDKRGVSWAARPFGPVALGGRWAPTGREDATVVIGAEDAAPGATLLAAEAGHYAYLVRP